MERVVPRDDDTDHTKRRPFHLYETRVLQEGNKGVARVLQGVTGVIPRDSSGLETMVGMLQGCIKG
jgi:hypothetical protein